MYFLPMLKMGFLNKINIALLLLLLFVCIEKVLFNLLIQGPTSVVLNIIWNSTSIIVVFYM